MILDVIAALIITYGFYIGFSRGIIKTVFATLSVVIGIVAALKLSPIVIGFLQHSFPAVNQAGLFLAGLIATFFLVMLLIRFLGNRIENLFELVQLNFVNKIAGGAIMSFLFALILSYGFLFLKETQLLDKQTTEKSITYPIFEPLPALSKGIAQKTKPMFQEFWTKMLDTMDTIKEKSGNEKEIDLGLDKILNK